MGQAAAKPRLLTALYQAGKAADAAVDAGLAQVGLTSARWAVLKLIEDEPGITGAEIARRSDVSPAAVTTMLERLRSAGLVERRPPQRGRVVGTFLTDTGRQHLHQGDVVVHDLEQALLRRFRMPDPGAFCSDLEEFTTELASLADEYD